MTLPYRFDELALLDIEHAALWYNIRSPGLGNRFTHEVIRVVLLITHFPNGYPILRGTLRRAVILPFRYVIVYELLDDEVVILAVLSQKQNSSELQKRVGEI